MQETMEDMIGDFAGFTEAKYDLKTPTLFSAKMEMKKLTLVSGANSAGKSLSNKLLWVSTFFFNMKLVEHVTGITDEKSDTEILQYILDNTFVDQDFNGKIQYTTREQLLKVSFYKIEYSLIHGKVVDLIIDFPKDAKPMGDVTYLSKDARDFGNIEKYLKIKKMIGIDEITSWDDIEKLGEFHKIYDIFAIEGLLAKFNDINPILKMMKSLNSDLLSEMGIGDLVGIEFNKEKSELYYITESNEKKRLSTLGIGTQSMLLMMTSTIS